MIPASWLGFGLGLSHPLTPLPPPCRSFLRCRFGDHLTLLPKAFVPHGRPLVLVTLGGTVPAPQTCRHTHAVAPSAARRPRSVVLWSLAGARDRRGHLLLLGATEATHETWGGKGELRAPGTRPRSCLLGPGLLVLHATVDCVIRRTICGRTGHMGTCRTLF